MDLNLEKVFEGQTVYDDLELIKTVVEFSVAEIISFGIKNNSIKTCRPFSIMSALYNFSIDLEVFSIKGNKLFYLFN